VLENALEILYDAPLSRDDTAHITEMYEKLPLQYGALPFVVTWPSVRRGWCVDT